MGNASTSRTTQNQQESSTTNPWAPQGDQLQHIFSQARNLYDRQSGSQGYGGNFVAGFRPEQTQNLFDTFNWSRNNGVGQRMIASGDTMMNQGMTHANNALGGLLGMAGQDPTQANIRSAGQYANNPEMDGMVQASMRDAQRSVAEGALPSLYRGNAASGNINSSKMAISDGLVRRGLADRTADVSSTMRGNAYSQGLNLAEGARMGNMGALGQAAQLGLGQFGQGMSSFQGGHATRAGDFAMADGAAQGLRGADQAQIDNDLARFNFNDQRGNDLLQRFYSILGAGQWGGTTTGTQSRQGTSTPSLINTLSGVAGTAASLMRSDRRVKFNVSRIGELFDGLAVYRWEYIDEPGRVHIGLMAQEVKQHYPDAVLPDFMGILHVNTDLATRAAANIIKGE